MINFTSRHDQSGQSLVSVLMTAFIASIVIMALNDSLRIQMKSQANIETKSRFNTILNSMNLIIDNPELCKKAFWNAEKDANKLPAPKIAYFNPDDVSLAAEKKVFSVRLGSSSVLVNEVRPGTAVSLNVAINELDRDVRVFSGGLNTYLAKVQLLGVREKQHVIAATKLLQEVPLYVQTDANHQIINCGRRLASTASAAPETLQFRVSQRCQKPYSQNCNPNVKRTLAFQRSTGAVYAKFTVGAHCSSIRVRFLLNGNWSQWSDWLGYQGSGPYASKPKSTAEMYLDQGAFSYISHRDASDGY